MPLTFSWMDSFMSSYLWKRRRKVGMTLYMMANSANATRGTTARKIHARSPPMTNAMTKEKTTMRGARMARRTIIM